MLDWHHQRRTDLTLRLCGLSLCGLSFFAIWTLVQVRALPAQASPGAAAVALAAVGFLCASAGAALLTLGHHIFDEIEVAERWRQRRPPQTRHDQADVAPSNHVGAAEANGSMSSHFVNWEKHGATAINPRS